jgi:hypothetical protein
MDYSTVPVDSAPVTKGMSDVVFMIHFMQYSVIALDILMIASIVCIIILFRKYSKLKKEVAKFNSKL